jgi:hypothetical protein
VIDHGALSPILDDLRGGGIRTLIDNVGDIHAYRSTLASVSPDRSDPAGALAYWLNLYNAGALLAAEEALRSGATSILRLPNAFGRRDVAVDGEALSLDDIEHGKIRRFGDPRVHAALVCGSVSCPTLRSEPFTGQRLDEQLDDQMRTFLASGGAVADRASGVVHLSSIFLWYGRDFTRPDAMPTLAPEFPDRLRDTIAWWMSDDERDWVWTDAPSIAFLPYDWGLACSVSPTG